MQWWCKTIREGNKHDCEKWEQKWLHGQVLMVHIAILSYFFFYKLLFLNKVGYVDHHESILEYLNALSKKL